MRAVAALLLLLFGVLPTARTASAVPAAENRLRLFHTHTLETLDIVYRRGNAYIPEALEKLNRFLRDHRTGDVHRYNPRVFDLLHSALAAVGRQDAVLEIICGYRTPWSNEYLRKNSAGVAKKSLHMRAEAIDVRLPGTPLAKFRDAVLALKQGGVGYYPASNFIHVDVGRVRRW